MAQATRTFRIFVSSTFSDLKAERNALQKRVWPQLRLLCARHGARFQAIDLRWGVSQEASLDQQTMAICLDEIARCQRVSPRPNFLVLLGDRYGSHFLPTQIPAAEYEAICEQVARDEVEHLNDWYMRDDNAIPPEFALKPRTPPYDDYDMWTRVERELRGILLKGAQRLPEGSYDPSRYRASATEQEIVAGALKVANAAEHVHCFFRSITNPDELLRDARRTASTTEGDRAGDFIDVGPQGGRDSEADRDLATLKGRLRAHLPMAHIHSYQAHWTGEGLTTEHLPRLCDDVYAALAGLIEAQLAQQETQSALDREEAHHEAFAAERRCHFQGRETIRQTIAAYLAGGGRHPLVIYGASGTGKSALLAQASAEARARHSDAALLVRFISATPESSDLQALLQSLCRSISRRYGRDETAIPTDLDGLIAELPKRLALATAEHPLLLFLDALDQLGDGGRQTPSLQWLPTDLPEHVHLVVTALSNSGLAPLQRRLPASSVVELERMSRDDGGRVLERWLAEEALPPRTLQPWQQEEVLGKFAVHGLPLYLRLAFEEARRWKSYTSAAATTLDAEISGIIRHLFARLSAPANHGVLLVARGLGYLAAAKHGLSEDEMLDVLSADADVLRDFRERSPTSPHADRLPMVIWSRLYFDLEPYLIERSAEGAIVLAFYHRQLGEAVSEIYLSGDDGIARHRGLARYFATLSTDEGAQGLRCLAELPYQQTMGELWDEIFATLTNFRFLEQKAARLGVVERTDAQGQVTKTYSGVYLLQEDYDLALQRLPTE